MCKRAKDDESLKNSKTMTQRSNGKCTIYYEQIVIIKNIIYLERLKKSFPNSHVWVFQVMSISNRKCNPDRTIVSQPRLNDKITNSVKIPLFYKKLYQSTLCKL